MASIDKVTLKDGKTIRYVVRYETVTPEGRRKQLTKRFAKAKEAQAFLAATVNAINEGSFVSPEKITVAQWMDRWFDNHKQKLQSNTRITYEKNIEKIKQGNMGGILLQQLRANHIDTFYAELAETVTGSTIRRVHANLHASLKVAVRDHLIIQNPSDLIDLPKKNAFKPAQLSSVDVAAILQELEQNHERYIPATLAATGGLRLSEVLGLKWSVVDFRAGTVRIETAVVRVGKAMVEKKQLKNDTSYRVLRMPSSTMELLKRHKKWQATNKLKAGGAYATGDWVCTDVLGNRLTPDMVRGAWQRAASDLGYEGVRFHDLRHANITYLLSQGMPVQAVSKRAGHSQVSTTTNIYAHVLRGMEDQAAQLLESYTKTTQVSTEQSVNTRNSADNANKEAK